MAALDDLALGRTPGTRARRFLALESVAKAFFDDATLEDLHFLEKNKAITFSETTGNWYLAPKGHEILMAARGERNRHRSGA
jgi:hypothetical protein